MTYQDEYQKWLASPVVDQACKDRLKAIKDDKELASRFGKMLDFGTAGLRGVMGDGLDRINIYTVRYATQGLAAVIKEAGADAAAQGCVIAYDSRHNSRLFAQEAAAVLVANDITCYLFDALRPTPELSFAVRLFGAQAGINITASHNPKEYNGYKVYWEDGAQIAPNLAARISQKIAELDIFESVKTMPFSEAMEQIKLIGEGVDEAYLACVMQQSLNGALVKKQADRFGVVYTPFHGAGHLLVPQALRRLGLQKLYTVAEQMTLDGDFPTVKSPNPENKEGFTAAIALARQQNCDLIIGTDPDCDRLGVLIRSGEDFCCLSGNQIGVLLLNYIINARREQGILPDNAAFCRSIVSTPLADAICWQNGVTPFAVLTGFKYIGEKIKQFADSGEYSFIFGFEESCGYLCGSYARDKDAVLASMLTVEMAAWYQARGLSIKQGLEDIYRQYGWYKERVCSFSMDGWDGPQKMLDLGLRLRRDIPHDLAASKVVQVEDLKAGTLQDMASGRVTASKLPKADVLFYYLADGSQVVFRPSGTEPKVKFYLMLKAADEDQAVTRERQLTAAVEALVAGDA